MPKTYEAQFLLLDTHIWLWLVGSETGLAPNVQAMAREAAAAGALRLATMSIWETAMLASRSRIALDKPIMAWIEEGLGRSGAHLEPLSPEIAVASCHLPGGFHSDPADEIIVATARVTGATLITRDRRILDYAAAGHVTAMAA